VAGSGECGGEPSGSGATELNRNITGSASVQCRQKDLTKFKIRILDKTEQTNAEMERGRSKRWMNERILLEKRRNSDYELLEFIDQNQISVLKKITATYIKRV
jgi:hypothetical protein